MLDSGTDRLRAAGMPPDSVVRIEDCGLPCAVRSVRGFVSHPALVRLCPARVPREQLVRSCGKWVPPSSSLLRHQHADGVLDSGTDRLRAAGMPPDSVVRVEDCGLPCAVRSI